MGLRGIHRIVVAVRDLEASKRLYGKLLGAEFHAANWTGAPFGIEVAIAWNAGLELCAPAPGREQDSVVSPFLDHYGEGIVNVLFGVDDIAAARRAVAQTGLAAAHELDYTQQDIDTHLNGLFSCYQELFIDSRERCGFNIGLARVDRKFIDAGS